MTAVEPARRRPRAFWADLRFLLGVVLIVASVAGVWFVVSAARQTVPVLAASRTIVPGEQLDSDVLRVVDVALGQLSGAYVGPGALPDDAVAIRTIDAGELVPTSAVGAASDSAVTSVVVRSSVDVPASVTAGSVVEIWAAPAHDGGGFDEPRILVPDATVVSVTRDDSMIGGGAAALELVIPRADVAATLGAVAAQAALSVVPTAGGSG